ncbi:MAG: ABC transporter substrate-binding protein [Streptomycetaceae bacterium]|nr:ABC transporter substrate-binding protein [Streptomycetaceae bacterium]
MDRRRFLVRGLQFGGLAAMGVPLLAACGGDDDDKSSGGGGGAHGKIKIRLSWIKNVEFAGEYLADTRGYYLAEGFSGVELVSGGPSAPPQDTDVVTRQAFVGISAPDVTGAAVKEGAPLKIIGAQYQKNPFCVMSLAKKPIATPQDMYGKKIGVQATNETVWSAFLKAANLDGSRIQKVPAQFDPTPLTTGDVDGWFSFVTNEPNTLKVKGIDTVTFKLADFGYPLVSETFMVLDETIKKDREKVKAFLRAEIRGWKDSLADPAAGAALAVEKYGKDLGLDVPEQTLESQSQNALILTDDTRANGLFSITDALVEANIQTLKIAGIDVRADQLFDLSLLREVYAENPALKA